MINLLIGLAAGAAAFGLSTLVFSIYASILPGVLVGFGVYVWLAQHSMRALMNLSERAQKEMTAGRLDRAAEVFRSGFPLEKRQFLVGPAIHANLGMLLYVKGDFEAAVPHLEKGMVRNYQARAMLACWHFRQKDTAAMKKEFEHAVKYGKKDGLMWSLYAYCLSRLGDREEAMKVLGRGVEANASDERLKKNLLALQNNKRLKMQAYGPQFYQFHLEPLPPEFGGGGGRRVIWQRR